MMAAFIHHALFGVYPYIALSVFLIGSLVRFDTDQYGWRSKSSQLLRRKQLIVGSILFHVGILGILAGHAVGLLTPVAVFEVLGISHGFKQMMAIVVGGICGIACFVGLAMLLHRRLFDSRIRKTSSFSDIAVLLILFAQLSLGLLTIPLSLGHLDGAMMVRFMNYVQGIVTLRSSAPDYITGVPLVFKMHMFLGFTIFLIFPFTRLVHEWSAPVGYLFRSYQVVRTRGAAAEAKRDDLPPYVARPALGSQPVLPARRRKAA
jgi:nitrate reductase gamma subunit